MAAGVRFTKAALTVVEKGRPDELILVRRTPTDRDDSGWLVRTAEKSYLRNKEFEAEDLPEWMRALVVGLMICRSLVY